MDNLAERLPRVQQRLNGVSIQHAEHPTAADAEATIDQMRVVVASVWEKAVMSHGGSRADCEAIRPAFDNPGFDTQN